MTDKGYCELCKKSNGTIAFSSDITTPPQEEKKQYEYPYKWNKNAITYAIVVKSKDAGIFSKQRRIVGLSLTTWGLYIPIKFKRVKITDYPDITIFFLDDLTTPYIPGIPDDLLQYSQKKLTDSPSVLAFAWYPNTTRQGIVVFNDARYNWDVKDHYKNKIRYYNALHTMIHELGHTLGLSHEELNLEADVMDPYYHDQVVLSESDIIRIRKKYGTRVFSRWSSFTRFKAYLTYRKRNLS